jgi:chromate transporter
VGLKERGETTNTTVQAPEPSQRGVTNRTSLRTLALLFMRLGATAFGGPAAHIALMEDEVVRRRGWMSSEEFLDLLGATNLIPGPNSTELAIHIGHARRGLAGLVVAGSCFIAPAALSTLGVAWLYVRFGQIPTVLSALYGVKPVILAVVAQALWSLAPKAAKNWSLRVVGVLSIALVAVSANELGVLLAAGVLGAALRVRRFAPPSALWLTVIGVPSTAAAGLSSPSLLSLFLFFAKVGSVLFGSGYVLLAFLRTDLVDRWGWLSEAQLLDAIAVGQFTPGPLFTTATFIGYVIARGPGALVATLGIFLPAFVFVALSGPLVPRLRRSRLAGGFLDGVNVASLALMAVVSAQLARAVLVDVPTVVMAVTALVVLVRFRINSVWLVASGGLLGAAIHALR